MEKRLRFRAPSDLVSISLDGQQFDAQRGEPLAISLYGNGIRAWARSSKFHRPRGPACFRGTCDGCLLRVDGVPNVMTCLVPAAPGQVLETQNTLGTRDIDLLQMADWLFPHGVNHHELFAGVPVLQDVMQSLARRVVGLGVLPSTKTIDGAPTSPALRRSVPVLVVGAGAAGLAVATAFARKGMDVELVDEGYEVGGSLRALPPGVRQKFAALESAFQEVRSRINVRPGTLAAAIFPLASNEESHGASPRTVLLVDAHARESHAELVTPDVLVLATGAHDAMPAFPGNDVPGVLPLRAAGILVAHGVLPGRRPLFLLPSAEHASAAAAKELASATGGTLVLGEVERVHGSARVRGVSVRTNGVIAKHDCDALVVSAEASPAYELALQCGAKASHEARGFVVQTDASFSVAPQVFAVGTLAGSKHDPVEYVRAAAKVVRAAGA